MQQQLTNTQELSNEYALVIAPNPTNQILTIQHQADLNPSECWIYSLDGQLILHQPFRAEISIAHLTKGMYILELATDKGHISHKFVKQ